MFVLPNSTARASSGFVNFIIGLITTRAGWIIVGCGLFIGGLIWGLTSHQISSVAGNQGVYDVSSDPGYLYLQQENTSNSYVIYTPDFRPQIDESAVVDASPLTYAPGNFSFVARTDTIHIAYRGWFHPIEKLTLNGRTYISDEYPTYLNSHTVNNWPYASALMLMGVLCTSTVLFFMARSKRRQKLAVAAERAELDARPSPFARELAEDEIPFHQCRSQ